MSLLKKSVSTPQLRGILEQGSSTSSLTDLPTEVRPQIARSVSFAPLPEIKNKKKKGSRPPLGIASRSAIIRKRMRVYQSPFPDDYPSPNRTTVTLEGADSASGEHLERLRELRLTDSETDDPVLVFGRMVKEASRNFWRKLNHSENVNIPAVQEASPDGQTVHVLDAANETELEPRIQVQGGVWEEEVDERYQRPFIVEKELPLPPPRSYSPISFVTTSPSQSSDCSSGTSGSEPSLGDTADPPPSLCSSMTEEISMVTSTKEHTTLSIEGSP